MGRKTMSNMQPISLSRSSEVYMRNADPAFTFGSVDAARSDAKGSGRFDSAHRRQRIPSPCWPKFRRTLGMSLDTRITANGHIVPCS